MVIFITVYTKFVDEFRNLLFSYSLLEPLYHPNVTKKNADKNEHGHGINWNNNNNQRPQIETWSRNIIISAITPRKWL